MSHDIFHFSKEGFGHSVPFRRHDPLLRHFHHLHRLHAWRHSNCRTSLRQAPSSSLRMIPLLQLVLNSLLWVVLSVLGLFTLSLVHVADSLRRLTSMQCIYGVPKSAGASVATVGLLRALLCFYFLAPVYRCLIFWSCLYLELGELWRIQVGEDGPTHQPIETIPSLRLIPDLTVMRPADGNENRGCLQALWSERCQTDVTRPDGTTSRVRPP